MEYERPPEIKDDRHWKFILMVAGGTTKADAAREVGYNPSTARNQGYRLAKRYKEVIDRLIREEIEYLESNDHRILAETAALAYSSVANYVDVVDEVVPAILDEEGEVLTPETTKQVLKLKPWHEIDPADIGAIKRIATVRGEISLWLHDKIKPLELLGQYLQLWGKDAEEQVQVHLIRNYGDAAPEEEVSD